MAARLSSLAALLILTLPRPSAGECTNCLLGPVILPPYFLAVNFVTAGLVWGGGRLAGSEGGYWKTVQYGVLPAIAGGVLDGFLMFREDYRLPFLSLPLVLAGNVVGNRKSHLDRSGRTVVLRVSTRSAGIVLGF